MKTDELREKYLAFFETKGHRRCPSDVLVPTWDPSVLFTPAGMNQFKDHFLGKVRLEFTRATTCQKCLRTGDIDNVGRTPYHHTFFEMLGNFSFGDYFKRESILWAWEFLTSPQWLGMDPQRLSVSVYLEDDEAYEIWHNEIQLPSDRIARMGEHDNFWPAGAPTQGPDGVCGPCSEIFFHPPSGKPVEIWNLVFTQFNRQGPPPNNLIPLPSKNIDTGMGLERAAATLQGVDSNFHIDILFPIVQTAAEVCRVRYEAASDHGRRLRRITDHIRACTMAVHENVYPGPQKEKYVIRRLLRRAVLDGHRMGMREPFLWQVVPTVVEMMRVPYPELTGTVARVQEVIRTEEQHFFGTIDAGLARAERIFQDLLRSGRSQVPGEAAAELYQTYGFPPELLESLATDRNLTFDGPGFRAAMEQHGDLSGRMSHAVMTAQGPIDTAKQSLGHCDFVGYDTLECEASLEFILAEDQLLDRLAAGETTVPAILILNRSPFYAESGGQVGDSGEIFTAAGMFHVRDTRKDSGLILHLGELTHGILKKGDCVTARVDASRRAGIRRAHSATHLLHQALQEHLGSHAQQQGSKVDDDWLRFDFTHLSSVPEDALVEIERQVRQRIQDAAPIRASIVPLAEARRQGAMMLFGEKYPDPVRMICMGEFSKELCGGTHLDNTRDVVAFELITEESVSAGTRRVVALTGPKAEAHEHGVRSAFADSLQLLNVPPEGLLPAVQELSERLRQLRKHQDVPQPEGRVPVRLDLSKTDYAAIRHHLRRVARFLNVGLLEVPDRIRAMQREEQELRQQLHHRRGALPCAVDDLLARATKIDGVTVVVTRVEDADAEQLRQLLDQIRKKAAPCAILLAAVESPARVTCVSGISRELIARGVHAGHWVREAAQVLGGGGGGRPDMAQAGGKHPEQLDQALQLALSWIQTQLSNSPSQTAP